MDAAKIIRLRESLGLSRQQLAERLGTSYETVSRWETGARPPSKQFAARLAELRDGPPLPAEAQWIFLANNLARVRSKVADAKGPVLGVLCGVTDARERIWVVKVRVVQGLREMLEIVPHLRARRAQDSSRYRLIGSFIAGPGKSRPTEHVLSVMRDGSTLDAELSLLFDPEAGRFTLWRPLDVSKTLNSTASPFAELPYVVVGGALH